jgi:hypothetical protein
VIARLAVAEVGLVTVTGPGLLDGAPPTEMPGPKLAEVLPLTKLVYSPVMVTEVEPAVAEAGLSWIEAAGLTMRLAWLVLAKLWPVDMLPETNTL